ncbi:MAG: hypothetical protein KKH61_11865 [Gammaproteobacteria bacterium]|nr:hypothetical protein [Gammaproteobacteria bacterium]
MSWVTFAIAVLGAGLGVFNTVSAYRRGAVRWRVFPRVQMGPNGALELFVDLVNTGRVAVSVEEVTLAGGVKLQTRSDPLKDERGYPTYPFELPPGKKRTIGPVYALTLHEVSVLKPLTIVAQSEDGRRIQARCPELSQLYMQLQGAQAERPA